MFIRTGKATVTLREGFYLCCGKCGDENGMHHAAVTVYSRSEDSKQVLESKVSPDGTSVYVTDGRGNPSERRSGIAIEFWCEHCEAAASPAPRPAMRLTIAQHKGQTRVEWQK